MEGKECPMCGEFMRLHAVEVIVRIPGTSQEVKRLDREWRCPECDYFEEETNELIQPDERG
jgi:C4-type Zn-finger protein